MQAVALSVGQFTLTVQRGCSISTALQCVQRRHRVSQPYPSAQRNHFVRIHRVTESGERIKSESQVLQDKMGKVPAMTSAMPHVSVMLAGHGGLTEQPRWHAVHCPERFAEM